MAEYIKREALVDLVLGKLRFMGDARIMNKGDEKVLSEIDGYEKAIYAVHELLLDKDLIEDIQPVKRGEWAWNSEPILGNPYGSYECSECGNRADFKYNYCCSCGAKMKNAE